MQIRSLNTLNVQGTKYRERGFFVERTLSSPDQEVFGVLKLKKYFYYRKGSAKKNRLRVDSSSNDDEEEEEEEEESDEDEDEDEIETDMDEDEESSDNRADAPIRNAIRKHFIDDEAGRWFHL